MRKLILSCASLCLMALLFSAGPARAQNVLWVAATGADANVCSQSSPCATFQGAVNKGSVSQINCLGSGNYGAVTITASITIDCGAGNVGTISVPSAEAIYIVTNSPATIVLRHLSLNGNGTATYGIATNFFHSGTLIVEDCVIQGFVQGGQVQEEGQVAGGIYFYPQSGRGLLQVSNSQFFKNLGAITVQPLNGQIASVTLNQVEMTGNLAHGLYLFGTGVIAGTMRNSVAAGNGLSGVVSLASQVYFTIEESSIVANLNNGIHTHSAGAVVNVGASTIGGNGRGVFAETGSIISFGNNQMSANGTNGSFTSTVPRQ